MKTKATKTTAIAICAAMMLGTASTAVHAINGIHREPAQKSKASTTVTQEEKSDFICKDETVYVLSGADGSVRKVLVNDWLQNSKKAEVLNDKSNLSEISNVKGDETYTSGKNDSLVWEANGQDIYYQGTTTQDVPVQMSVHYTLDGKDISPADLAGKSGKVTIRFDYKNTEYKEVQVNGKKEKIYVPFTMLTGVMLDTDVFRNVTVSSGKVENLGNQIAVIGVALPGMQENLGVDKKDIDIPDYVEITADVEQFEMGTTMTLATTALFNELNSADFDFQELTKSIGKLTDGMTKLMDGSDQLYNGLNTLLEQSQTLVSGIDQLATGATRLQSGADALNSGAAQLQSGATQLYDGLSMLNSNSAALNGGAEQVFSTLLSTANTQLSAAGLSVPTLTIGNYADVLNGVIASLDKNAVYEAALQQVTSAVNGRRGEIQAMVTEAVRQQVLAQVTAQVNEAVRENVSQKVRENEVQFRTAVLAQALGMTIEEYNAAVEAGVITQEQQDAINTAVESAMLAEIDKQMQTEEVQAQITTLIENTTAEKMGSDEIIGLIDSNTEAQVEKAISDAMASDDVQAQLQAAAEGAKSVIALKSSLDSYNGFYLGLLSYTSGVSSATAGANELISGTNALKSGTSELYNGTDSLSDGILTMRDKSPALIDGITQLRDGAKSLQEGLNKFMNEGVQKIVDLATEDLKGVTERASATIDVAQGYTSFSGIEEGTQGTVKFIYKTDGISINN